MKLRKLFTYFTDTIFREDINEWRNPVVRWLVQQYRLLFSKNALSGRKKIVPLTGRTQ